jgi:hypothetical protein
MEQSKVFGFLLSILIVSMGSIGIYIVYNDYSTHNSWTTHNITGNLTEMHLYNQFPTTELYIVLDNGNYTRVDINPFWAYAQLINFNQSRPVTITYQENNAYQVKITHIVSKEVK